MITGGLKVRSFINAGLLLLSAAVLVSCSESGIDVGIGGGDGGGGIDVADGGISGTGISSGSISAFSSVIVNGTKLEVTTDTSIFIDDQTATQSDLKVGYVIRVEADFDSGIAEQIDYSATVLGPITATPVFNPDTLAGSMDVLGQTVLTNSITIFDGVDPSTLIADDVLEVSGVRNASGEIVARYISRKTLPVDRYQVLGRVAGLNPPTSFSIGNLSVSYLGADTSQFGPAGIQEGDEVRVRALPSGFVPTGPVLNAEEIKRSALSVLLSTGDTLELEGVITDFLSLSNMTVNGLEVDASSATIENGTEANLQLDVLVEIEGQVSEVGVLIASKVKIVPLSNIRVEATVDSVNLDTRSLFVLGQEFFVDDKTQFEDKSSVPTTNFSLSDLLQSNRVELRAFELDDKLVLSLVERDDADTDVRIQGPVDAFDGINKTVTVLGIVLTTDTSIPTEYEDAADNPISESLFFSSIDTNSLVQAKWKPFINTSESVDELSIEID